MPKLKTELKNAEHLAGRFSSAIGDVVDRIEIAGSIRRRVSKVGDIEIVCIPKFKQDMFGDRGENLLEIRLQSFMEEGRFSDRPKNGQKYKQFIVSGCSIQIDLFITTSECFPVIKAIRTGPAKFSKLLVTQRSKGGYLENGYRVSKGRLVDGAGQLVDLENERDFFEFMSCGWIAPEDRSA